MKKMICLTLALTMLVLCVSGCASQPPESTVLPNQGAQSTKPTGNVEPATEPSTEPVTEPTTQPTTEPVTEPAKEESNLSLGRMEGGTYVNEYMGIQCQLNSNWTFFTAKELEQGLEHLDESTKGTKLNEAMADVEVFTDMMAENVADLVTINVVYQKLTMTQILAYTVTSEEEVVNQLLGEEQTMGEYYSAAGITLHSMEKVKVTFLGDEHFALLSTCSIQDVPYYTLQLFNGTLGEYSVTLTLASYVENNTQNLLDLFTAIK